MEDKMTNLSKTDLLFSRNDSGKLVSKDVVLETIPNKPSVKLRPLTRGVLNEVYQKAVSTDMNDRTEADNIILRNGLDMDMTEEDYANIKPQLAGAMSTAILAISLGITQEEVASQAQDKVLTEAEEFLKKK